MKEQLIQYVELLFAGTQDCDELKQQIMQRTLAHFDRLREQGMVPEDAYRAAILGIGDIHEILGSKAYTIRGVSTGYKPVVPQPVFQPKQIMRAVAVGLYILCPLPMLLLSELGMDVLGLCGTLVVVAVASVLMILGAKKELHSLVSGKTIKESSLRQTIRRCIFASGFMVYLVTSFTTRAWHVTWLLFPIASALHGLVLAVMDLKEGTNHEE